jgi:hypothetical protein
MLDDHHPVWVVYDLYKTARLNVKYYAARLNSIERQNFLIELVIAIAAPTSAVTGIWLLKTDVGQELWKYLAGIAAIAAILNPLLKLSVKIKNMEQCLSGYRALEYDVEQIINKIKTDRTYSKSCKNMLDEAQKKKKVLVCNPPENKQDQKLIERLYNEVNNESPVGSFYLPEATE